MKTTSADLPNTIEDLRALVLLQQAELDEKRDLERKVSEQEEQIADHEQVIAKQQQAVTEYSEEISQLREYIRLLKSQHFGPQSERSSSSQLGLFNEAEAAFDEESGERSEAQAGDDEPCIEVPAHTRRKRGGRRPLPAFLPREEIVHDVPEEERVCGSDSEHRLTRIGEERLEQLVFVPAEAKVVVHIRPRYACSSCKDGVTVAPPPPQPIPKSFATPSLLAQIITSKYVDALPLYRQAKIFQRMGVDLCRATLASWVIRMGDLVVPLLEHFLAGIRGGDYVQADETPFQVLKEGGKRATSKSYLWALRGGVPEHPLLYYEYAPTRSGKVAQALLEGFEGFLHTDGYWGYDGFDNKPGVVHVGCFAHTRRKFDEALRGQGRNSKKSKPGAKASLARQGLQRINKLYEIERSYADVTAEQRHALRQERLAPKLEDLREWTDHSKDRVPPTSLTGKAISYLDTQWPKLLRVSRWIPTRWSVPSAPSSSGAATGCSPIRPPAPLRAHGCTVSWRPRRRTASSLGPTSRRSSTRCPGRRPTPTSRRYSPGASSCRNPHSASPPAEPGFPRRARSYVCSCGSRSRRTLDGMLDRLRRGRGWGREER
jgi:transposase